MKIGDTEKSFCGKDVSWIETFTGNIVYYDDTNPASIDILDIAHHLSQIRRFAGATSVPYTVGQHSIAVYERLKELGYDKNTQLAGLLHDAAEAYTGDIPRGFKRLFPEIRRAENQIMSVIVNKWGLEEADWKAVKEADDYGVLVEGAHLLPHFGGWGQPTAIIDEVRSRRLDITGSDSQIERRFFLIWATLMQEK